MDKKYPPEKKLQIEEEKNIFMGEMI